MKQGAILFETTGGAQGVLPANGTDFSLEELQGFVGGYIEVVHITENVIMVVNEEGKAQRLEPNGMATVLAKAHGAIFPHDYIAGNALMCPSDMVK